MVVGEAVVGEVVVGEVVVGEVVVGVAAMRHFQKAELRRQLAEPRNEH